LYIVSAASSVLQVMKMSSVPVSLLVALRYFTISAFVADSSFTVKPAALACFVNSSVVMGERAEHAANESTVTAARMAAQNFNSFFKVKPPI
jgi:hypothetical protein